MKQCQEEAEGWSARPVGRSRDQGRFEEPTQNLKEQKNNKPPERGGKSRREGLERGCSSWESGKPEGPSITSSVERDKVGGLTTILVGPLASPATCVGLWIKMEDADRSGAISPVSTSRPLHVVTCQRCFTSSFNKITNSAFENPRSIIYCHIKSF